ncbi:MAG: ATP-dependent DNA ligase [Solirubrobacterales bacterium]
MTLPLAPPIVPQLARARAELPAEDGWVFEQKFDGFRALAFVDGDEAALQSRAGKPLDRYFPELRFPPGRYVLDGEIVIDGADGLQDFDALSQRIHPAASRIERLAVETPARFVAFDLLALGDEVLMERPYAERRAILESVVAAPVQLAPSVRSAAEAEGWLHSAEGVVAKLLDAPYQPGKRTAMVKVKRVRTIDCVVVGWRPGKEQHTVGSLILGLYNAAGTVQVVGHTSGLGGAEKRALVERLAPYESGERGSAEPSRWNSDKDLEWVALRPELVVEISYEQVSGERIRHGTKLLRWREDKSPRECGIDQLRS